MVHRQWTSLQGYTCNDRNPFTVSTVRASTGPHLLTPREYIAMSSNPTDGSHPAEMSARRSKCDFLASEIYEHRSDREDFSEQSNPDAYLFLVSKMWYGEAVQSSIQCNDGA